MRKNLLLYGEIGCGKSTLIQEALASYADPIGGFLTVRRERPGGGKSRFFLLPGQAVNAPDEEEGRLFLDPAGPALEPSAFEEYGAGLLDTAGSAPFALLDEFGGVELLCPAFREKLKALLLSPLPCIGVFKTARAGQALAGALRLSKEYERLHAEWSAWLGLDPDTELVPVRERGDRAAAAAVREWVTVYAK